MKSSISYWLAGVGALNKLFCNLVRCFPRQRGGENFNHLRVVEEERERNAMLEKEGEGRGRHLRGIAIFFKDLERTGLSPLLSRPPGGTGVGRILPPLCTSPPIPSPSKAISIYEWFSSTATRLSTPNPLERLPLAGLPTFLSLCRPLLDGKNRQSAPATTI